MNYKVGDKVIVTKEGFYRDSHKFQVGEVVELTEKCQDNSKACHHWDCKSLTNDSEWYLDEDEFEPFESEHMTELEIYQAVNKPESLLELAEVIRSIGDTIQGKDRPFNASKVANLCENFHPTRHNTLTRNYGIRQQAMMLHFYKEKGI